MKAGEMQAVEPRVTGACQPAKQLLVASVASAVGLWWVAAVLFPVDASVLFGEEGPVEQWSDAILLGAILVWATIAVRRLRWALPVALYLTFLLMEETDWGAVYGVDAGHSIVDALVGRDSFHELSLAGVSFFAEVQHWFVLPALGFFGFAVATRLAGRPVAHDLPREDETAVLAVILGLYVVMPSPLQPPLDDRGMYQLLIYGLFAMMAVRRLAPPGSREALS